MKKPLLYPGSFLSKYLRFLTFAVLLITMMGSALSSKAQIYYTLNDGTASATATDGVVRVGYDGTGATTLASSFTALPTFTAIDFPGNRAFVYEGTANALQIRVVNLSNGSLTRTITVPTQVAALRYDAASDFIYYLTTASGSTLAATDALRKVKSDGTSDQLVLASITASPKLLALDLTHGQVIVEDVFAATNIMKVIKIADGSSTTLISSSTPVAAIDYNLADNYIYYLTSDGSFSSNGANDALVKIHPDGTGGTTIASSIGASAVLLAVDAGNNRAFIYDGAGLSPTIRTIRKIDLGTGAVTAVTNVASLPNSAAIIALNVPQSAVVTTTTVAGSITTSATLGGNITSSDLSVSERGVVYSSSATTPVIGASGVTKASNGTGTGSFSASISGLSGSTTYYVRAYATSGAGTAYGAVVQFTTLSNDANLSGLSISAGTLTPAFSSATISYTATVANTNTSVTITPTRNNAGASIQVNNIAATSGVGLSVNLNIGDNAIPVKVTAQDGTTTKTYTLTVTRPKAAQTITFAGTATKTFGDADFAPGASTSSGLGVSYSSDNLGVATIVSGQIHIVGAGTANITASQAGDGNYLAASNVVQALTVNKVSQTITFNAIPAKTYGTADFAPGATSSAGLTISYSSDNSAVATIVSNQIHIVGQGTANITASQAGDANRQAATSVAQVITVNKATVTITANAQTKIYGADDPTFTYTATGVVGSDAPTGALSRVTPNTNRFIGTYAIDQGTLSYGGNYNITYTSANLTINKRPITVLPSAKTKVYGDADPFLNQFQITSGSLAPGDATSDQFGRAPGESVGTYQMTLGNKKFLTDGGTVIITNNYDITVQPANFTITVKSVIASANAQTKTYGDADPALSYVNDSLPFGETFSGSLTRAPGESFGTYAITQGTLALSSNYTLTFNGNNLTIGKKTINVTANAKTKTYGTADPAFDYTNDALAFSDGFTGTLTRDAGENVGNHAITQGSLALNSNYTLNYTGANLSIGKTTLTYVATQASRPYLTADPTYTGSVTGFVNGDNQASATTGTLSFTTTATINSGLGSYPINGSGLSAANYDFVQDASNATALTITASTDATLANLTVDQGTLSPVFSSEQTSYGFSVANNVTSFNLTATVNQANATLQFTGGALTSGITKNVPLNAGPNNFNVIVTAQDGSTTKYYTLNIFRAYDTNNLLAGFNLGGVTYSPAFNANTLNYTATVSNLITSTDVTATAVSPTTHVFVNGYDLATTSPVNATLNVGETEIGIVSKAENGDERIYKVTVTRAQSPDATLASFGNTDITLNTPFVSGTHTYSATVANGVGALTFRPTATSDRAVIKVNGNDTNPFSGNNVNLAFGNNAITFDVTSEDGANHITYNLNVYRLRSSDATLSSLSFPFITSLNESFDPAVFNYTATVADSTYTGIPLSAVSTSENAIVKIDGTVVPRFQNYTLPVHGGPNTYHIVVTSQDTSATKTYTLVLTRAGTPPPLQSPVANLASLSISSGSSFSKNFNFAFDQLETVNAPNSVASVRIFPNSENAVSTVTVNGIIVPHDNTTDLLPISVGDNLFTILVTAEDGVHTKTYSLHINRLPFVDVSLASLTISNGTLAPVFNPGTRTYNVTVPNNVSTMDVTPVATVNTSTIKIGAATINASNPTATVNLFTGPPNRIRVVVLAADGVTTQTYSINVTRQLSTVATLSSVKLSTPSTLVLTTGPANYNYTTSVDVNTSTVRVIAASTDPGATIRVNDVIVASGSTSDEIPLTGSSTVINTVITAQDGVTTKTYAITVHKGGSSNAILSSLTFSTNTTRVATTGSANYNYVTSVDPEVTSLTVTPAASEPGTVIRVNGVIVTSATASGAIDVSASSTVINILVTAPDGVTTKTYAVTVIKLGSNNAGLASVKLNPASVLTKVTGTTDGDYTTSVDLNMSTVKLTPNASDARALIKVNGTTVASGTETGDIALSESGPTVINIQITAHDGVTVKNYTVTVSKTGSNNALLSAITFSTNTTKTLTTGPANYNYITSVDPAINSLTLTPTANDVNATILVNGVNVTSGTATGAIALTGSSTVISLLVTAQDGITTKTYQVTVNKTGSNNANLTAFKLSPTIPLTKTGASNTSYTTLVDYNTATLKVIATTADPNATIKVNGATVTSGVLSGPIALNAGMTPTDINMVVTAQDGVTTNIYTITVNKTGSHVASLKSIKLSPSSAFTKTTGPANINFITVAAASTSSVKLVAVTNDANSTFKVNGVSVASGAASGAIALTSDTTMIAVTVTAQDGITKLSYSVAVLKTAAIPFALVSKTNDVKAPEDKPEVTEVIVHQGVSPNGDGINDYLTIDGLTNTDNQLSIMNGSGVLVFETKGYGSGGNVFDGHSNKNGSLQNAGTYFYSLDYKDGDTNKHKTGYIILKY